MKKMFFVVFIIVFAVASSAVAQGRHHHNGGTKVKAWRVDLGDISVGQVRGGGVSTLEIQVNPVPRVYVVEPVPVAPVPMFYPGQYYGASQADWQARQAQAWANEEARQAQAQANEEARQARIWANEEARQAQVRANEESRQTQVWANKQAKQISNSANRQMGQEATREDLVAKEKTRRAANRVPRGKLPPELRGGGRR